MILIGLRITGCKCRFTASGMMRSIELNACPSPVNGAELKKTKSPDRVVEANNLVLMVAGVGFEPTTFGL
jgi:hypothetical protein